MDYSRKTYDCTIGICITVLLLFLTASSGCIELPATTKMVKTELGGYEFIEHTHIWGDDGPLTKTYDIRAWDSDVTTLEAKGITKSEFDSALQTLSQSGIATSQASAALEVVGTVYGSTGGDGGQSIEKIYVPVTLVPGGGAIGLTKIDMSKTVITFSTEKRRVNLQKSDDETPNTWKIADKLNAATGNEILEVGEQFDLEITLSPGIPPDERFTLEIKPPVGCALPITRVAPPEIRSGNMYALY